MSANFFYSFPALMGINVITMQLFAFGWLGSKLEMLFEKLSAALYNVPWVTLNPKQRINLQLVLLMSQKLKIFHGVFIEVDFGAVQSVRWI